MVGHLLRPTWGIALLHLPTGKDAGQSVGVKLRQRKQGGKCVPICSRETVSRKLLFYLDGMASDLLQDLLGQAYNCTVGVGRPSRVRRVLLHARTHLRMTAQQSTSAHGSFTATQSLKRRWMDARERPLSGAGHRCMDPFECCTCAACFHCLSCWPNLARANQ